MNRNPIYSLGCFFRLSLGVLLAVAALALIRHFVFDIMPVSGSSMFPNFHDRDIIVLNKISYVIGQPKRGDSVVLRFPGDPQHDRYIKRLIGMPGETFSIRDGKIYINGEPLRESYIADDVIAEPDMEVTLKPDQYFLVGDNRPVSSDSRIWGPAYRSDFIGKAFLIVLPFSRFQAVPDPIY
jgi:signal peptidase I